ncbi:aldo/keto reductase family oxidoreductase [Marivivens aquimaris]|uniref:aldo/keto reductase family oxidoreductase n=1 Tax=Marivivens aquimaris TaxID=2774876 RepID=UPI00187F85F1|nr:aldo/keto reductase family oxidoreductase [Marivivens aquimaris]
MKDIETAGTWLLGDKRVNRMGYGAMQLAGKGAFGEPRDRDGAIAVLREAMELGINHIDTSDFYGPHVTNHIIREALHPYADDLTIVTKIGARRDAEGNWLPAQSNDELTAAVEDNLRNLGLDVIDVVNMRFMGGGAGHGPSEEPIARQMEQMVKLQERGLIKHIGISNVTHAQTRVAREMADIVCVQNLYNLANRGDDEMIDELAKAGIAYVPFFPLGGFSPLQSDELAAVAKDVDASPLQVALAWLLRRSPNILLIPGTSSVDHLRENVEAATLKLDDDAMAALDKIGK